VAGSLLYLDSSAIVKLVVREPETPALRELLRAWPERVSSVIARIEVPRAARNVSATAVRRAGAVVARLGLVELGDEVIERAAGLNPPILRTLDAIHLATALSLGEEVGSFCAYDPRLADAAASAGMDVTSPA
jgi:predicted nucleic acid-binding protein